jgi:tetratricopeptide (TPR) repeat protein
VNRKWWRFFNLARVYRSKGEYARSESLYLQALEIQKHIWGLDHPDVARTLNNLARLYRAQGE